MRRAAGATSPATTRRAGPGRWERVVIVPALVGITLLVVLAWAGGKRAVPTPELPADCERPAFRLGAARARAGTPMPFTLVGPPGRGYVLAVDAAMLTAGAAGGYDVVPAPGTPTGQAVVRTPVIEPRDCRATGRIGLPFPAGGTHVVTMFDTSEAVPRPVASATVVVDPR